jgi:Phenylalanyl-tRNA synthetase beta subunit
VIEDSAGQVLSFPPIINNQLTEVSPQTTDLFVDVTGTSQEAVHRALCIMSLALVERGGDLEQVEVDGRATPDLSPDTHELDPDYLSQVSGLDLSTQEIKERLEMMRLRPQEMEGGGLEVEVPCYRSDVLHQYDLIEDVVIAHGYDGVEASDPDIHQHGDEDPVEEFSRVLRDTMVSCGALEAHTHVLSSEKKQFGNLERPDSGAVEMQNPLTEDYSIVRKDLLPELLRALHDNRDSRFPQRFFEVDDVAELDDSPTGASNSRRLAYVVSGEDVQYTDARRVLHVLERDLGVDLELKEAEMPFHADGRSAQILVDGERAGNVGQMSQQVQENWELDRPVAGFELKVGTLEGRFRS